MRFRRAALVLLALGGISCTPIPAPLTLGHVTDLAPGARETADQEINGIRLALEDYAKGPNARPFVVRHANDRGELENCEGQAVRLVTVNRAVLLLGGQDPACVERIAETGAPVIASIAGDSPRTRDRVVMTGLGPEIRGKALAHFFRDKIKTTAVVLFTDAEDDDARQAEEAFAAAWKEANGMITGRMKLAGKTDAWAATVTEMSPKDLAVVATSPYRFRELASAVKERPLGYLGRELPRAKLSARPGAIYLVTAFAPGKQEDKAEAFARRYEEKFKSPAEASAAFAYENARLAMELLGSGPIQTTKVREELQKLTDFEGLFGKYKFSGLTMQRPAFTGRWEDGALHDVERYQPAAEKKE